jgi:anti-anti-sigma factor
MGGNQLTAPDQPPLVVTRRSEDTFAVAGELDMATCRLLDRSIDLASLAGHVLVLDLSGLTFLDCTGVRALRDICDAVGTGCLVVRGARPNVRYVLEAVGLTTSRNLKLAP